jgi:hypothetical protein
MYEALQNPHYKKIWEKINWQIRHPEAKTLEEALLIERKNPNCLFVYNDIQDYVGHNFNNLKLHRECYDGMVEERINEESSFKKVDFLRSLDTKPTFLGRPITLEDILILFNGKFTHLRMEDCYYIFENTTYDYANNNEYTGTIISSTTIFKLKIRTAFEDETPETWETMANLIN